MGGKHVDDLKAGKTLEEVYGNYPADPVPEEEETTYAEDVFATRFPDGFLGGTFDDIDYNNDGVVSATEQNRWEHEAGQESEEEDPVFGGGFGTGGGTAPIGTDPVVGIDTAPVVGTGTGTGDGTGDGTLEGSGDGAGAGSGDGSGDGTGDGAGTGDGTGTGTGTGDGTGSGDGSGDGEGSGSGEGGGRGVGSGVGAGNGSRTTDSLFGDMLQLKTQIGSTQDLLKPFSLSPVPAVMNYNRPQINPIQQFVQQQQETQLRNRPQGMLTNSEILKRYPF
jgi:hypothetical protein